MRVPRRHHSQDLMHPETPTGSCSLPHALLVFCSIIVNAIVCHFLLLIIFSSGICSTQKNILLHVEAPGFCAWHCLSPGCCTILSAELWINKSPFRAAVVQTENLCINCLHSEHVFQITSYGILLVCFKICVCRKRFFHSSHVSQSQNPQIN